jgi:hypothetical protein
MEGLKVEASSPSIGHALIMKTKTRHSRKSLQRKLEAHIKAISRERDELRKLVDDASDVLGDTDEAVQSLQSAVDTLSQQM